MNIVKNRGVFFVILTLLWLPMAMGQIIAPSATEVDYNYVTTFKVPFDSDYAGAELEAEFHASHMFGLFHSPYIIKSMGLDANLVGGLGGPKTQMNIQILAEESVIDEDDELEYIVITYRNQGQMILHKTAADKILKNKTLSLQMPENPYNIYDQKCTDSHYTGFGDYWYFYDPYRKGCTYLSKEPYARQTTIEISKRKFDKLQKNTEFPLLRDDNGNGDLFSIYLIHGFAESKTDADDSGRENFKLAHQYFLDKGFTSSKQKSNKNYPYILYTKSVQLTNGREINIEIRSLLVETSIGSRSKIFAQFFKEAIENADVVIYAGHSGLGGNLDIPTLEEKAGKFKFPNKKQLFYFDSCSSYSYYLDHFNAYKTNTNIDIVTNGLSSYFHTSPAVLQVFLNYLISPDNRNFQWLTVLKNMESILDGETYLINVGGI